MSAQLFAKIARVQQNKSHAAGGGGTSRLQGRFAADPFTLKELWAAALSWAAAAAHRMLRTMVRRETEEAFQLPDAGDVAYPNPVRDLDVELPVEASPVLLNCMPWASRAGGEPIGTGCHSLDVDHLRRLAATAALRRLQPISALKKPGTCQNMHSHHWPCCIR